jgi:hypothetical protein
MLVAMAKNMTVMDINRILIKTLIRLSIPSMINAQIEIQ